MMRPFSRFILFCVAGDGRRAGNKEGGPFWPAAVYRIQGLPLCRFFFEILFCAKAFTIPGAAANSLE